MQNFGTFRLFDWTPCLFIWNYLKKIMMLKFTTIIKYCSRVHMQFTRSGSSTIMKEPAHIYFCIISVLFLSYRPWGLTSVSFICRIRKVGIKIILLNMHMIFTLLTKQQWGCCVIFIYFMIKYVVCLWWETVGHLLNETHLKSITKEKTAAVNPT